jgi:hypothetical protein
VYLVQGRQLTVFAEMSAQAEWKRLPDLPGAKNQSASLTDSSAAGSEITERFLALLSHFTSFNVQTMPVKRALFTVVATTFSSFGLSYSALAQRVGTLSSADTDSQVEIFSTPSTRSAVWETANAGDRVEILSEQSRGGERWYYVQLEQRMVTGWVKADQVNGDDSSRELRNNRINNRSSVAAARDERQYTPLSVDPLNRGVPVGQVNSRNEYVYEAPEVDDRTYEQPSVRPVRPTTLQQPDVNTAYVRPNPSLQRPQSYTTEQINYFMEVAMGAEFGSGNPTIRKWIGPVRVKVNGNPSAQDMQTLQAVLADLNRLTQGITIQLVQSNPNIEMHFAPEAQFASIEANYRPRNMGFFWTWWDGGRINRAKILISTTGVTQQERSHLIREELTQSLGLMRDSSRYSDSIFYQGWTSVTRYSAMDEAIISMLYRPEIRPGMTQNQVMAALRSINTAWQSSRLPDIPDNGGALDFSLPPR